LYIFFLIIICFAEAAIALGCVYCHFSFRNSNEIKNGMERNFQERFNSTAPDQQLFTEAVNYIQFSMKCCGILGDKDYEGILNRRIQGQGGYNQQQQKKNQGQRRFEYPTTCCVPEDDFFPSDDAWKRPPPKNPDKCQNQNPYETDIYPPSPLAPPPDGRYPQGCWTKISEYFGLLTCCIAAGSGGFAILQILGILFSLCFIRTIGEEA